MTTPTISSSVISPAGEADTPENLLLSFSEEQARAAEKCISRHIPFALYADKADSGFSFIAGLPKERTDGKAKKGTPGAPNTFSIGFFNHEQEPIALVGDLTAEQILSGDYVEDNIFEEAIIPAGKSTNRILYNAQVFTIKNRLKGLRGGGKAVLSRIIVRKSAKSPVEVAKEYFRLHPKAFRAIYYHPETGIWIVATPELLIDYDWKSHRLYTMALAGSRPAGTQGPWDTKNLREHRYVVRHIDETLRRHDIICDYPSVPLVLNAGPVEHLYTPISADHKLAAQKLGELLIDLSPTPAVAGYPLAVALDLIDNLELHRRYCYAGWIGWERGSHVSLYVNLRSTLVTPVKNDEDDVDGYLYNVYAGGGILSQSDADKEWEETELKSRNLCDIIGGDNV